MTVTDHTTLTTTASPLLAVHELSKGYATRGRVVEAIGNVDFRVYHSEFVALVGPSGCGKTTLLKCIAGLLRPSAGTIQLRGEDISGPPPDMAVVFQDYTRSLFPWLSVRMNVLLPIRKKLPPREARSIVDEALAAVGLANFAEQHPYELSGGMQQRVAIARALAYRPRVLLMDEPFASVDAQTRTDLEDLVLRVRAEFDTTVVLVTHDIDEAIYMADRVVVLSSGPSRVIDVVDVLLPRPRVQLETKALPEFASLRARVYRGVRGATDLTKDDVDIE